MLAGGDLAIVLFFLATAVAFALGGAAAAGWKSKILIATLFIFAALLFVIAAGWVWIKPHAPQMAAYLAALATSPIAWFVTFMFATALLVVSQRKEPDGWTDAPTWGILLGGIVLFIITLLVYPAPQRSIS